MKLSSSLFQQIAQYLLVGCIVAIPFFFIPVPWIALAQAKMFLVVIVALFVALSWTIATSMEGRLTVSKSLLLAVGALLPVIYLGSALLSGAPYSLLGSGVEVDTVGAITLWFVLMAASAVVFSTGKLVEKVYRMLLVSALVVEVVQLVILILGKVIFSLGLLTGPAASIVGSWHDLGVFLGFAVLLSLGALETNIAGRRWLPWAVLGLAFPILVVLNLVDIWIAIAVIGVLMTVYTWFIGWRRNGLEGDSHVVPHRSTFGIAIALFLVATAFVFIGGAVSSLLPQNFQVIQSETRPSWQGTAAVATSVYRGGALLFGSGPNTFDRQWALYKPAGVNETAFWNADFVQGVGFIPTAFVTVGVLGALAWIAFLSMVLLTAGRTLISGVVNDRTWRLPVFALVGGTLYLWVMLVVYAPGPALVALAFLMTGIMVAAGHVVGISPSLSWEFARSRYGFAYILIPAVLVIGIGAAGIGVARALTADVLVNYGISVFNTTGDASKAQASINQALTIYPKYDRALRGSVELNLIRFNQLAQGASASTTVRTQLQEALQEAISNGLSAVSADTRNYQNWLTLAGAYQQLAGVQVEGAYENAKKAYEQALAANPSNPQPYLQLAQLAALQGDTKTTREYLQEAINKKSNFADAHYLLSQLNVSENKLDEALSAAGLAVQSAPNEPLLWFQLGTVAYLQEKYSDAALALERAVALNANYANALYMLGFAYYQADRKEEAQGAFERVLSLNPENSAVAQIVSLLREGKSLPTGADKKVQL